MGEIHMLGFTHFSYQYSHHFEKLQLALKRDRLPNGQPIFLFQIEISQLLI